MDRKNVKPLPRMSGAHYQPKEGDTITIELPDERTRGTIVKVVSDETVVAKLIQYLTSRGTYRKDDLVPCRFERLGMNVPGWRAVSQRELDDADAAQNRNPKKRKRA